VLRGVLDTYFDGQIANLVAFYVENEQPAKTELTALAEQINVALDQK
jgi:predicted transcriptional regulator